jgi:hypothetical protein
MTKQTKAPIKGSMLILLFSFHSSYKVWQKTQKKLTEVIAQELGFVEATRKIPWGTKTKPHAPSTTLTKLLVTEIKAIKKIVAANNKLKSLIEMTEL